MQPSQSQELPSSLFPRSYVYQKAYVEFFCSPQLLEQLLARVQQVPRISYCAVNREGDSKSNMQPDGANAVTWGVFPGGFIFYLIVLLLAR